jgi:hypothetical protein
VRGPAQYGAPMPLLRGTRPDPPPLETDDVRTVAVGTAAWATALVVLVVLRLTDATRVETWWLVMCGYGLLLGVAGVWYCRRRQAAIERDKARGLPQRD